MQLILTSSTKILIFHLRFMVLTTDVFDVFNEILFQFKVWQ